MRIFGTGARLASWAARCPGHHTSAGWSTSGRTCKGPKWLGSFLHDAALAATGTTTGYLAAQYARLRARLGHAKALVAGEHSILVATFHLLDRDQPYHQLGGDYFLCCHDPARQARRLLRQLEALGYTV